MSPPPSSRPQRNRILAALPIVELARLENDLEAVNLSLGQVLYEAGESLEYVYFPVNSIVSLVFATENGSSAELAMTGNDGLVGVPRVLGGDTTTHRAVVQGAGAAYRLRAEVLSWELAQGGQLLHLCLGYSQALMTQMAQSVACNRHHTVHQQLCRWFLLLLDQLDGSIIHMTQEQIASMLGVRREAVTEAAGRLQADGLIRYRRGHIAILDRAGLEARVCECYRVVRSEYDRLFHLRPAITLRNRPRPNPATLRQRAEARLAKTEQVAATSTWDAEYLLHELQVHQIELEMHNEELRHAYDEADALREKYADIYDFAPIGYFTLDTQGIILQLNLAGAILLGIKRSHHGRHRFAAAIQAESLPAFDRFLKDVLNNGHKHHCEIELAATEQRSAAMVRIEAVPDEEHRECRMVVIDISGEKEAMRILHEREGYQRALLDNFPFMVWLKDEQSRYLAVNAPFAQNYGWSSVDELVGKSDFDITTRELAETSRADDMKIMSRGGKICTEQRLEVCGKGRWFETYKSPVMVGSQRVGTVGFTRDISQRKAMETELRSLAAIDILTSLLNRQHFLARLAESFAVLQREAEHTAVLLVLDLDHFQTVNELLGQTAGDAMLRLFSALLRDELRKVDVAGRLGGDEFAVLMPNANLDAARFFAERLRAKVEGTAISLDQRQVAMSVSIGIAEMAADTASVDEALARAETALRLAKSRGHSEIAVAAAPTGGVMPELPQ